MANIWFESGESDIKFLIIYFLKSFNNNKIIKFISDLSVFDVWIIKKLMSDLSIIAFLTFLELFLLFSEYLNYL